MIRIRLDIDYPYPSRIRSFFYTAFGLKIGNDYLKNPKIVARMINESNKELRTYWFFTPKTIPDKELLHAIDNDKHQIALHVVNDPDRELTFLEKATGRTIWYYTIHGTARFLARIMWGRWKAKAPRIPRDFRLESFHKLPTVGIDTLSNAYSLGKALAITEKRLREGYVIYFHPIWLFQKGKLNRRGPCYQVFKKILEVDAEFDTLTRNKKGCITIGRDTTEYERDVVPTEKFIQKLRERGFDIFTFIERKWCFALPNPEKSWVKATDNIAMLKLTSFDEWWKNIGKKTRNMIRKAEKSGIGIRVAEPDSKLAEGICRIYNETPIRQERAFPHYGISLQKVLKDLQSVPNCTYIGAYIQDELAGFMQLVHGKNIVLISQILSLQKYRDRAVNNAMVAKAIEVCASKHNDWIMYGRMGNHPSLDSFKQNNAFEKFTLTRYYVPLTRKGKKAIKLGLHREMKDVLPQSVKYPLIPLYSWISRTRMRVRLFMHH